MSDAAPQAAPKATQLALGPTALVLGLSLLAGLGLLGWRVLALLPARGVPDHGFDLEGCLVPRAALAEGMQRDGLPVLVDPPLLTAEAAEALRLGHSRLLVPGDRVLGVALGDQAVALPLSVLVWHEVALLELGGVPLAATYSALCDSAAVYDRRLDGETLSFGLSGLVASCNPLLYDRRPEGRGESLWTQLDGRAVAGPAAAAGKALARVPHRVAAWRDWKAEHPATRVVGPDLARGKLYNRDPYHSYRGSEQVRFPVAHAPPPGLHPKTRVLAVAVAPGGPRRVYPFPWLAARAGAAGRCQVEQDGVRLEVTLARDPAGVQPETVLVARGDGGPLQVTQAYWFAWYAWHPQDPRVE